MSDVYNHYFCGLDTISDLPSCIKDSLEKNMFFLGNQGADIFFYYNVLNWKQPIPYGSLIHQEKIDLFFYNFLNYIQSKVDGEVQDALYSYLLGFVCHHALDSITHPYIIYHCGIYDKDVESSSIYKYMHKKFEILLDVALLDHRYKIVAKKYNIQKIFKIGGANFHSLNALYNYLIKHTFGLYLDNNIIKKSIINEKMILSFLKNNSTLIGQLILTFEDFFSVQGYISNALYPEKTDTSTILNLDKHSWHHPCNKELVYTASYEELFENAVQLAKNNILSIDKLKNFTFQLSDIHDIFKDVSYETGLVCTQPDELQFFDKNFADMLIEL